MNPDEVLNYGLYITYKFNDKDKHLREIGLYCEELFSREQLPSVLKKLAAQNPPVPNLHMLAILPAEDVIVDENISGRFALYMQVEGRLDLRRKPSKLARLCSKIFSR